MCLPGSAHDELKGKTSSVAGALDQMDVPFVVGVDLDLRAFEDWSG